MTRQDQEQIFLPLFVEPTISEDEKHLASLIQAGEQQILTNRQIEQNNLFENLASQQDGTFEGFTKIGKNGEILPSDAQHWASIIDIDNQLMWATNWQQGDTFPIKTGLTWYYQADDYSVNNHDKLFNQGNNVESWLQQLNETGWCGYHDWRLPHITELTTLRLRQKNGEFDRERYKTIFGEFGGNVCWSSSYDGHYTQRAWGIYFFYGYEQGAFSKTQQGYFRPVRDIFKPLLITTGEPAGIGMDIMLQLAMENKPNDFKQKIIILADIDALQQRYSQLQQLKNSLSKEIDFNILNSDEDDIQAICQNFPRLLTQYRNDSLNIIHLPAAEPVVAGQLNPNNAQMVLNQLQLAHQLAIEQQVSAIVTAPLHKSVIMRIQPDFMGHTEFFMAQSGLDKVVMMLANTAMKVALVTTHLPLKDVPNAITQDEVRKTVEIVLTDCQHKFGLTHPKILVCGLNPHAGESGYLGREELDVINPVLQEFRDNGVDISLALPADTLFTPKYLKDCDVVIAMYHDQGLAPLKSHGFGETVNITLGLPYIRTSVDHGTALNLAGTGQASADSLYQALVYATNMADNLIKL